MIMCIYGSISWSISRCFLLFSFFPFCFCWNMGLDGGGMACYDGNGNDMNWRRGMNSHDGDDLYWHICVALTRGFTFFLAL